MTPEAALAAIDAARAQVARARADWDRLHRIDGGAVTRAACVYRDRLAYTEQAVRLAELAASRLGIAIEARP